MPFVVRWTGLDNQGDGAMVTTEVPECEVHIMGSLLVFTDRDGDPLLIVPQASLIDARQVG